MALADALGTNTMGGLPVSQRASVIPGGKFDSVENYQSESDIEPLQRQSREGAQAARLLPGIEAQQKEAISTKQLSGEQKAFEDYRKSVQEASSTEDLNKIVERRNREFVPTQETAGDIANIFTITNLLGFALGGLGKGHAQQAMSAMNGMLEGHLQGREDEYKKQKTIYEENQKALDKLVTTLQEKKKAAMELAKTDYDGALVNLKQEMHAAGMPFVAEIANKQGLIALGNYADKMIKNLETLKSKTETVRQKELDRQSREKIAQEALDEKKRESDRLAAIKEEQAATKRAMQELGGNQARQQQFIAQRAVSALGGVSSAAEAIMQLPSGTTTGILPNLQTRDGMFSYLKNSSLRQMSSNESKALETLFTGVTRNLAAIEASGAATGLVGLSSSLEKVIPKAGDTAKDVALKMADIRRIATENIEPLIQSGLLTPKQTAEAKVLITRLEKAIPFTTMDVVQALNPTGRKTMGESGVDIAGKLPKGIPPGSKRIGKAKETGKDVYEAPDGSRHIAED